MQRMHRLLDMADQDETYEAWKKSAEVYEAKCKWLLRYCPKKMRIAFEGYLAFSRMQHQCMLNIACANMKFIDEDDSQQGNG